MRKGGWCSIGSGPARHPHGVPVAAAAADRPWYGRGAVTPAWWAHGPIDRARLSGCAHACTYRSVIHDSAPVRTRQESQAADVQCSPPHRLCVCGRDPLVEISPPSIAPCALDWRTCVRLHEHPGPRGRRAGCSLGNCKSPPAPAGVGCLQAQLAAARNGHSRVPPRAPTPPKRHRQGIPPT